jgi:proteasome accessory factor C
MPTHKRNAAKPGRKPAGDSTLGQLARLLHVIPALADGEPHVLDEVAQRAGVDRETLQADLLALTERYDTAGGFGDAVQIFLEPGRVSMVPGVFDRPMRLTRAELGALELGLALLRRQRPKEEHRVIEGAAEQVRRLMAALPNDWVGPQQAGELGSDADLAHFRALQLARRRRRKVRLAYRKVGAATADQRTICPFALAFASGRWYLIARCEPGEAIRIFRLDRVEGVETLNQGFELPGSFTPDQYLTNGKAFYAEKPETLRIRYGPAIARWIGEREGLEPAPDGSLVVEHPLADPEWAVRHVLQYGPDAEVLAPEPVRKELRQRLVAMSGDR